MVKEKPVEFSGTAGVLEGLLADETQGKVGALVALHPHPLYGGSMDNNVVKASVQAGQACRLITLRFNLRGVGGSQGGYGEGHGEQDDLGAALAFLEDRFHLQTKAVVGYSFGACVALAYCHRNNHGVDQLLLISPPPFLLSKELSLTIPVVEKIILGEHDEIASPDAVKSRVSASRAGELLEVIPGADHFFLGKEEEIEKRLVELLASTGKRPDV